MLKIGVLMLRFEWRKKSINGRGKYSLSKYKQMIVNNIP